MLYRLWEEEEGHYVVRTTGRAIDYLEYMGVQAKTGRTRGCELDDRARDDGRCD